MTAKEAMTAITLLMLLASCTHIDENAGKEFNLRLEFESPDCTFKLENINTRYDDASSKELKAP